MEKNHVMLLGVALAALLAIDGLFFWHLDMPRSSTKLPMVQTPTAIRTQDISAWKVYENTKYHYRLKYPPSGFVQKQAEEEPGEVSASIAVKVPYGVVVAAKPLHVSSSTVNAEYKPTVSLDLRSFAEYGRQAEINYLRTLPKYNPRNIDVHTERYPSQIQTKEIGGQTAYGFSIKGWSDVWPMGGVESSNWPGYENYFAVESPTGLKFVIAYPADPIAQQIVNSFRFTDTATSTK